MQPFVEGLLSVLGAVYRYFGLIAAVSLGLLLVRFGFRLLVWVIRKNVR